MFMAVVLLCKHLSGSMINVFVVHLEFQCVFWWQLIEVQTDGLGLGMHHTTALKVFQKKLLFMMNNTVFWYILEKEQDFHTC